MTGGRRYTFHIEDPHDDPDRLAEALGVFERLGYPTVECQALEGRLRRRARDEHLRDAFDLVHATSFCARCERLAAEVARFESGHWLRWQDLEEPPEPCSDLRRLLFRARQCGPVPLTWRGLYDVLKRGAPCDFSAG